MLTVKNLKIGNDTYSIRDNSTYRSLSQAQATTLLDNGTYNNEEVDNGEIFTCDDGAIKQYVKEDLGVGIDVMDYNDGRIPCNKVVIENGVPVLYATNGTDTTTFLKSTDYGKTWTSVASNRGSLSCYKQRMFYENGVFYVMRTSDGSSMYLDFSSDGMATWNTYTVGSTNWYHANNFYIAVNSTYIVVGYSYSGYYRQFRAPLSDLSSFTDVSNYSIRQVYVFNDLFVCGSKYSSDAYTWTNNNIPSTRECVFFKNNKMYVLNNSTPAYLYSSSDGMSFASEGVFTSNIVPNSFATFDGIDEVYAFVQTSPQLYYSTKDDLLTWTQISDDFIRSGQYEDVWFVNNKVCFEVSQSSNTRRGIAGVQYNRSLNVLTKLSDIAEAGKGIKFEPSFDYANPNFTTNGTISFVDGVASNFDSGSRLNLPQLPTISNSCEILVNFAYTSGYQAIFTVPENNANVYVDSDYLYLWDGEGPQGGTFALTNGKKYWLKVLFNGSSTTYYGLEDNGYTPEDLPNTFTTLFSINSNIYSNRNTMFGNNNDMDATFKGSANLNQWHIKIDGDTWWTPYTESDKTAVAVDILTPSSAPSSSLDGFAGQIAIYNGNAYICVDNSNTWKQFTS